MLCLRVVHDDSCRLRTRAEPIQRFCVAATTGCGSDAIVKPLLSWVVVHGKRFTLAACLNRNFGIAQGSVAVQCCHSTCSMLQTRCCNVLVSFS